MGPPSSSARARGRPPSFHGWRRPLPDLDVGRVRAIPDAEVLELVARALGIDLTDSIDRRRLRRLNSAVNRYRLERRACQTTGAGARYTSRAQVARSLYGPDVELDDVKRQMRRVEADLELAGLLEVSVAYGHAGESRALRVKLLDPRGRPGARARRTLARRPETRAEVLQRRVGPWRRQQSDRARRGGVPGLYVRRSDLEIAPPGSSVPFGNRRTEHQQRERRARRAHDAQTPTRARRLSSATGDRRAGKASPGPRRWAALSRLRQAAREGGRESLLVAIESGAPPAAIAVVAFERRFVWDLPDSWAAVGDPWEADRRWLQDRDADVWGQAPSFPAGVPLSDRWARRLEAAAAIVDRETGRPGAGMLDYLRDVWRFDPRAGAGRELTFPASAAYFVARLQRRARAIRRMRDPDRARRSLDHVDDRRNRR